MSGRNPSSYCTLTLIAMQGHQQKGRQTNTSSNNKDNSNTIIETSTAEDHDDENLHNPSTQPRCSIFSRFRCCCCAMALFLYMYTLIIKCFVSGERLLNLLRVVRGTQTIYLYNRLRLAAVRSHVQPHFHERNEAIQPTHQC